VTTLVLKNLLWVLGAYLLGATPTSYLVARAAKGVDLREFGSRNLGATNLYRLMGWKGAVPVALYDIAKGTVPVLLAARYHAVPGWFPLFVGLCAVLGHVFSPFVRFRGGKGVATAAGVFVALAPWCVLVALVVWGIVLKLSGYVSLSSMIAGVAFAASAPLLYPDSRARWVAAGVTALFIIFTHRANLRRLLAGTENRFGRPKPQVAA